MTVYLIAHVTVNDDAWVPAYAASVHDIVHRHGGKYLSRSGNVRTLQGADSPKACKGTALHRDADWR